MNEARRLGRSVGDVGRTLQAYADRGVFRGFSERLGRAGRREFRFEWLTRRPVAVTFEAKTGRLTFRDLLPNVGRGSPMDAELKRFVASHSDRDRPPHRRTDPRRAEVSCTNRRGRVSVALHVKARHYEYAARAGVNLVNEIFNYLKESHAEYMWANFDVSRE